METETTDTGTTTYTATGLPPGLSISAAGVISGAVTETGTSVVTISTLSPSGPSPRPESVTFVWVVI